MNKIKKKQTRRQLPTELMLGDCMDHVPAHIHQRNSSRTQSRGAVLQNNYIGAQHAQHDGEILKYAQSWKLKVPGGAIRIKLLNLTNHPLYSHLNGCTGIRKEFNKAMGGYRVVLDNGPSGFYKCYVAAKHFVLIVVEETSTIRYSVLSSTPLAGKWVPAAVPRCARGPTRIAPFDQTS